MLIAALAGALVYPLIAHSEPAHGSFAPDFVLKAVDGQNVRLSEYRGDTVVLSFWANWCGRCRETLSQLNTIAPVPGTDAPVLLGVNLDGDAGRAASVAKSLHLSYPMLVDRKQSVARLYDIGKLPLTLLIDRDGRVRDTWAGDVARVSELTRQIKELQSR